MWQMHLQFSIVCHKWHIYILGGLTVCLLGLVTWVVSEIGLEAEDTKNEGSAEKKKDK